VRKSQTITLTVVAAMAIATARGLAPAPPVDPNGNRCAGILNNAGTPIPSSCFAASHNGFTGARMGGFGATAQGRHAGG